MPAPTITAKEEVMEMIRRLPDDASIQEIEYNVSLLAGIHESMEDIEAGRTVTQAEVERLMDEWQDE